MFKGLTLPANISRFIDNMKNIDYVEAHWQYRLAWGVILFLKELIIWTGMIILAHWINAEISVLSI